MGRYLLFSTLGCHLCEQAKDMLSCIDRELDWREVEIADSEELIEAYGVRIPVLKSELDNAELSWPFDEGQLRSWLDVRG